jgi:hypothetical protein
LHRGHILICLRPHYCTVQEEKRLGTRKTEILSNLRVADVGFVECHTTLSSPGITLVLPEIRGAVHVPATLPNPTLLDAPLVQPTTLSLRTTNFVANVLQGKSAKMLIRCVKGVRRSARETPAYHSATDGWMADGGVDYVPSKRMNAQLSRGFISQPDVERPRWAGGGSDCE